MKFYSLLSLFWQLWFQRHLPTVQVFFEDTFCVGTAQSEVILSDKECKGNLEDSRKHSYTCTDYVDTEWESNPHFLTVKCNEHEADIISGEFYKCSDNLDYTVFKNSICSADSILRESKPFNLSDLSLDPVSLYNNGVAEGMVVRNIENVKEGAPLASPVLDFSKPKNYELDDACTTHDCDTSSGKCVPTPIDCDPKPCHRSVCTLAAGGCTNIDECLNTKCTLGIVESVEVSVLEDYALTMTPCAKMITFARSTSALMEHKNCENPNWCIASICDDIYGCIEMERMCYPDDIRCKYGVCNNVTKECEEHDIEPKPFICKTAVVISTAVIAGIVVACAVAEGLAIFGGKKGYDYWKLTNDNQIGSTQSNPLYENKKGGSGDNPLFDVNSG
eukprot:gene14085-16607_t